MEILDFSIEPGAVREIHCQGSYVYFYGGSAGGADATIGVKMDAIGERVLLMPGQAFRMEPGKQAQRWIISNHAGQATIAGRLVIGSGKIDDNRVTGSVEVIDGGKNRTLAGQSFFASGNVAANAGTNSGILIFNPAGSIKNLLLKAGSVSMGAASSYGLAWCTTFAGAVDETATGIVPKKWGAMSVAKLYAFKTTSAAGLAAGGFSSMDTGTLSNNTQSRFLFQEPVVLEPGYGALLFGGVVNVSLVGTFEFTEDAR